jgi:S-DNA-T family DNA segregation ATPase FtsK/SpoIIIE
LSRKGASAAVEDAGLFSRLSAAVEGVGEARGKRAASAGISPHVQEICGLTLVFLSLWLFVAMVSYYRPFDDPGAAGRNWGGQFGFYFANLVFMASGVAGLLFTVLGAMWGVVIVARKKVGLGIASFRLLSAMSFVLAIAFLIEMAFGGSVDASSRLPYGPGGWFAMQSTPALQEKFGTVGLWILMSLLAIVAFMLATEMAFYPAFAAFGEWARKRREQRGESTSVAIARWGRNTALGLWDFVRGAGIGDGAREREVETKPARSGRRQHPIDPDLEDDGDVITPLPPRAAPVAEAEDDDADEHEDDELGEPVPIAASVARDDDEDDDEDLDAPLDADDEPDDEPDEPLAAPSAPKQRGAKPAVKGESREMPFEPPTPPPGDWKLPPVELLEPPERRSELDNAAIDEQARKLEQALASFRVEATVVGAQVGPTVILFELEVSQGTRMNKVTQLSQEIAAALRAQSVRIIAPIPGKATIGIEVPNLQRRKVRLSELVSQRAYDKKLYALPLFLGVDAEGQAIVEDIARMPHLLIAGTTGSGKSVCINTILASLLLTRSPHDVQTILIDPKMVELQIFSSIPHLMLPVVSDMRQATAVINWAVEKMEGRYELFNKAGVRNIKAYNALSEDELREHMGEEWNEERTPRHVPYIVVVIDEFADLMMQSKKEAEQAITRLAQKSRAVGIHVVLATQRPSIDVITGVIKGNLPTRIAFQVASKVDSRVILDAQGAEKLLGGGDMLYTPPASSRIKRVQGALVEDHELQKVIDFVCRTAAPNFNQELVQVATGSRQPGDENASGFEDALSDPMWNDAVRVILKSKRGSASLLQRALGVGYTRASRLLDMMGEAGIVSDHKGSKAREVLMTLEQWEEQNGLTPSSQGGGDE